MKRHTVLILYVIVSASCFSKQITSPNHTQDLSLQSKPSSLLSSFSQYRENQAWVLLKNDEIEHFKEVFFCDKQIGYILGTSYVWSTTDGGVKWIKSSPANGDEDYYGWLHNLSFPRAKLGWVTSSKGVFKTIDGGKTWLAVRMFYDKELSLDTNDIYWLNDKVGWVIYDGVYKTLNEGNSWQDISPSDDLIVRVKSYSFIDKDYGWVLGEDANILQAENTSKVESFDTLTSTEDGGKSWQVIPIPKSEKFSKVLFTSKLNGWLIGYNKLYSTRDGGETWKLSLLFSDYIK